MDIHINFIGGNIKVLKIEDDKVYGESDIRDSIEDWFYWAFCVEGAEGKTVTFCFENFRLGYFGPAVSHDLKKWNWLGSCDNNSFTYTFSSDEGCVYFAHDMLYHPNRFEAFARKYNLEISELCKSRKGRSVPCIKLGNGKRNIILSARHHACESTGSYVLEGVLEGLINNPIEDTTIFCVPFVDYDGVTDGDQGKFRAPYDHNRDYTKTDECIYPETQAICRYADFHGAFLGFDFHSPWHYGDVNDKAFIVQKSIIKKDRLDRFGKILEGCINKNAFKYEKKNDYPPNKDWNMIGSPCFGTYMLNRPDNNIAFTLETAYFGEKDNVFTQERGTELGRCFANAIHEYIG